MPNWVKSALEIDGVSMTDDDLPCCSCGGCDYDDLMNGSFCKHSEVEIRLNGSTVCTSCERLLDGEILKDDPERCAECGRRWRNDE